MASIDKHGADTLYFIRHNMRELPPDKTSSNLEIDPERTPDNYSIISRGNTAEEVNDYRKQIESEVFHYNRKNLVRSVEVVITLPKDCPSEQEDAFFKEAYNYVVSTLPMGEKCVFLAEVHKDEGQVQKDGVTIIKSPPHIHIMYVPAVPDEKHDGYAFKLCADQLTKRAQLKQFHPKFQKWLDDAGISATVHNGTTGGQNISVAELKQLTKETGLTLVEIKELQHSQDRYLREVAHLETMISGLNISMSLKDETISNLREQLQKKEIELDTLRTESKGQSEQNKSLHKKLKETELLFDDHTSHMKAALQDRDIRIINLGTELSEKDKALTEVTQQKQELEEKVRSLESQLKSKDEELKKAQEDITQSNERTWGNNGTWGRSEGWGNHDQSKEVDRTW